MLGNLEPYSYLTAYNVSVANPSRFAVLMGCVCVCEIRRRQSDSTGSFTYISNALSLETRIAEIGVGVRVGEVNCNTQE